MNALSPVLTPGTLNVNTRTNAWFITDQFEKTTVAGFDMQVLWARALFSNTGRVAVAKKPGDLAAMRKLGMKEAHKAFTEAFAAFNQKKKFKRLRHAADYRTRADALRQDMHAPTPQRVVAALQESMHYISQATSMDMHTLRMELMLGLGVMMRQVYGKAAEDTLQKLEDMARQSQVAPTAGDDADEQDAHTETGDTADKNAEKDSEKKAEGNDAAGKETAKKRTAPAFTFALRESDVILNRDAVKPAASRTPKKTAPVPAAEPEAIPAPVPQERVFVTTLRGAVKADFSTATFDAKTLPARIQMDDFVIDYIPGRNRPARINNGNAGLRESHYGILLDLFNERGKVISAQALGQKYYGTHKSPRSTALAAIHHIRKAFADAGLPGADQRVRTAANSGFTYHSPKPATK